MSRIFQTPPEQGPAQLEPVDTYPLRIIRTNKWTCKNRYIYFYWITLYHLLIFPILPIKYRYLLIFKHFPKNIWFICAEFEQITIFIFNYFYISAISKIENARNKNAKQLHPTNHLKYLLLYQSLTVIRYSSILSLAPVVPRLVWHLIINQNWYFSILKTNSEVKPQT